MISCLKKALCFVSLVFGSTSFARGQAAFFEVSTTPYDRQMTRVQTTLTAPSRYTVKGLSFALVNEWMIQLRAMPYRYSREWRTPAEVEAARMGDCKGKAVALYDRMQLNGATNLRLVIGKRRANDLLTHAWLEWDTEMGTILLDPTFNWTAALKMRDQRSYIPFYGYEGPAQIPGRCFPARKARLLDSQSYGSGTRCDNETDPSGVEDAFGSVPFRGGPDCSELFQLPIRILIDHSRRNVR